MSKELTTEPPITDLITRIKDEIFLSKQKIETEKNNCLLEYRQAYSGTPFTL